MKENLIHYLKKIIWQEYMGNSILKSKKVDRWEQMTYLKSVERLKTRTKSSESDPETEVYKLIEQLKSYLE